MDNKTLQTVRKTKVAAWSELQDREPAYALVGEVDLVVIRSDDKVSVLYGRCLHRGALLADGHVEGENLICGLHNWDYRYDTGVSEYNPDEDLEKFNAWIELDASEPPEPEDGSTWMPMLCMSMKMRSWPGKKPTRSRTSETNTWDCTPIITAPPRSPTIAIFKNWPGMGWRKSATMVKRPQWGCRSRSCRAGMICKY